MALLFAFSGCAGLIFEVIWTRQLALVLGSTLQSASLITGCFLFCLGLGAWLAGRIPARYHGLKAYAAVELLAATSGAAVTWLLPKMASVSQALPEGGLLLLLSRLGLAALLLAVPCLSMGASLPLLCRWLVSQNQSHYLGGLSRLYAVNTLGAVAGVWLADWILIRQIGLFRSGLAAAFLDVLVGLLALGLGSRWPVLESPTQTPKKPEVALKALLILFGLGFSGSLIQLIFTRSLIVFQGSDITAFSTCLIVYLAGLSLGGHLASWGKTRPRAHLHSWVLAAAVSVLLSFFSFAWSSHLPSAWSVIWTIAPTAICLGACFPLASHALLSSHSDSGQTAASSVLANTIGSLSGALMSGFVLIPFLGMQTAMLAATSLLALLGLACAPVPWRRGASALLLTLQVALLFGLSPFFLRGILYSDPSYRFLFWGEDGYGSVALVEQADSYTGGVSQSLMVDGFNMMGDIIGARRYATAIGALPVLLQAKPEQALVICFGLAHTASSVLSFEDVQRVDCVELSPTVIEAVSRIDRCAKALQNPKMHLKIGDGRHHLLTTQKRYQVIVAEPPPPMHAGVVNLYTREYYQLCANRLEKDGWTVQWLPIFQLSRRDTRTIIRAFLDVFPNSYLVDGSFFGQLLLIGSSQPLKVDYANFVARANRQKDSLRQAGWDSPALLLSSIIAGPKFLASYAQGPALTDDWPILSYDRDYNPDYGTLVLQSHPREFEIHFSDPSQEQEFRQAEQAQRAAQFYYYQDVAARSDPDQFAWRSTLEVFDNGRLALESWPKSDYLQTTMLCGDYFMATRGEAYESKPSHELALNLARAHYLRGQFKPSLDYIQRDLQLKSEPFMQAFEILVLFRQGQAEEARTKLAASASQLQPHDRQYLAALLQN